MDALWLGWAWGGGARADINEFMVRHKKLMMHEREMKRVTWTELIDVMLMIYGKTRRKVAQLFNILLRRLFTKLGGARLTFDSTLMKLKEKWLNRQLLSSCDVSLSAFNWQLKNGIELRWKRFIDVSLTSHKIGNYRIKSGPLKLPHRIPEPVKARWMMIEVTVKFQAWFSAFSKISLNWK